jgi:hypothetical protein
MANDRISGSASLSDGCHTKLGMRGAYPAMVRWEQGVVIVDKIKSDRLID